MTDSRRLEAAMFRSVAQLVQLVGWQTQGLDGELDRDQLPACVLTACENAINFLAVGADILDPDSPGMDVDADEALARFTERRS